MMVNVASIYLLGHFGIPQMKKRGGGAIINLASVQGHACQRGVAAYAASKGAVHSLTRAMALDHASDNIRVNSISPGSINTPMLERSAANFAPGVPRGRGVPALGPGPSGGADWDAGRGGGTGGIPGFRQSSILHRRRLPGGWRAAGRHWGAVISRTRRLAASLCRAGGRPLRRRRGLARGALRGLLDRHQSLSDSSAHIGRPMRPHMVLR